MATRTYADILATGDWRPLPNCPGRSVWRGATDRRPSDLLGDGIVVRVVTSTSAPDPIHIAAFADGGLISYEKPDGRFVHTLNTTAGFARKLADLGLRSA